MYHNNPININNNNNNLVNKDHNSKSINSEDQLEIFLTILIQHWLHTNNMFLLVNNKAMLI
jgi:hypothetical protein